MDLLDFLDEEEVVRVEAMLRDELVDEVKRQICYSRESLMEVWQEKKQLKRENKQMADTIQRNINTLKRAKQAMHHVAMWRITSYLLAVLVMILCFANSEYIHATF